MQTPLSASASTAGAILSGSNFVVPQFQREYSWLNDQVDDFWSDLQGSLASESYFLGLLILTDEDGEMHVVDGQQRLITLSLLSAALYHEALARDRKALAERISANFLKSINYQTDEVAPRVRLSDNSDNLTFQTIIDTGIVPSIMFNSGDVSSKIVESYRFLRKSLQEDLKPDPFKRLGSWTEFINDRLYFAVFVHPDPSSAYQVFEVINTRGRELTTADLLKNNLLSQTAPARREERYKEWQDLSGQFESEGTNNFVQYIRHVVTVYDGHVLPKNLYSFLAGRMRNQDTPSHSPDGLMEMLNEHLSLYRQMIDPSLAGPATPEMLDVFAALNSLNVLAVRPILLAIQATGDPVDGMRTVLKLVVRRIMVGSLGTGNVERRLGEVAKKIHELGSWDIFERELRDLNPPIEDFVTQLRKRSYNKNVLTFMRRSIVQNTIAPANVGNLHFICPRQVDDWAGMSEEDRSFWASTLGNTFLSDLSRRPWDANDWDGFKATFLSNGVNGELVAELGNFDEWNSLAIDAVGKGLADVASDIWY